MQTAETNKKQFSSDFKNQKNKKPPILSIFFDFLKV